MPTISALPAASSVGDTDLTVVVDIGSPNVTKRATAGQMRAGLLPLTGGTLTGALALNNTLTVGGTSKFNDTATMNAGGRWSSANIGKQLLITTPANSSYPGIGITDQVGTNLFGVYNLNGTLTIASMPAYSDAVTAPAAVVTVTKTAVTLAQKTTVSSGGLVVSASGAAITGASSVIGTTTLNAGGGWSNANVGKQLLITSSSSNPGIGLTDSAGTNLIGIFNGAGALTIASMPAFSDSVTPPTVIAMATKTAITLSLGTTISTGGLTVSAGGAAITGNSTITGTLGGLTGLTVASGGAAITGNSTITGTLGGLTGLTVASGGAAITGNSTINGTLGGLTGLTVASGGATVGGSVQINSGVLVIPNFSTIGVTSAGQYGNTAATYGVTGTVNYSINAAGGVIGSIFYANSDARLKTDIRLINPDDAWDWLRGARPVTFVMDGRVMAGFIAQEDMTSGRGAAVSFIPDERAVFAESDGFVPAGHRAARSYEHDIAYLTAALQDALRRIEVLEAR